MPALMFILTRSAFAPLLHAVVYTRFETTTGLPVEYGTVHICSVLGGLIFYREFEYMDGTQCALTAVGLVIVVLGVALSARQEQIARA